MAHPTQEELREILFDALRNEMIAQDEKWGEQDHDFLIWNLIFQEEFGEVAEAYLERRPIDAIRELIQATAVLCQWICRYTGCHLELLVIASGCIQEDDDG